MIGTAGEARLWDRMKLGAASANRAQRKRGEQPTLSRL
jgi:hypothetical protein